MELRPSQKELQSWFKDTCGKGIAQCTLSGILKESNKWLHREETALSARDKQKKKQRSFNVEELEELLYTWFLHMEAKRAPLTDLVTIEAAQLIGTKLRTPSQLQVQ